MTVVHIDTELVNRWRKLRGIDSSNTHLRMLLESFLLGDINDMEDDNERMVS